jgi:hypothetical protein
MPNCSGSLVPNKLWPQRDPVVFRTELFKQTRASEGFRQWNGDGRAKVIVAAAPRPLSLMRFILEGNAG